MNQPAGFVPANYRLAGKLLLILSERYLQQGKLPVHALLATGAVHHHLVKTGLRCDANIVVETGVARDSHHFACLIGFGATMVYPYLVYQSLHDIARRGNIEKQQQLGRSYRRGIRKGLFKIMSKMGISSISSYRGAQLFEIVGFADKVVERCFRGTTSRIQGSNFDDLWGDQKALARAAWDPRQTIDQGGLYKYVHGGEYHCYNPDVIATLQAAVRTGDYSRYQEYSKLANERPVATRRDLMETVEDRYGTGSTIITSQLPIDTWHDVIDEPTFADAILDRLVHNAHRLPLDGPSMRKTRGAEIEGRQA